MAQAFTYRTSIIGVAVASAMALSAVPAFAQVPVDGLGFDMDGNIGNADGGSNSNGNNVGHDWEDLVTGAISPGDVVVGTTGISCEFVTGNFETETGDITVAWKGGTKDFNDFDAWNQKDFSASAKSDLINVATAAWLCDTDKDATTEPELIFQFAADRKSTNGTTFLGLWALQNEVSFSGTSVAGNHQVNDILTITDFQGSISAGDTVNETLGVYKWVGPGNGTLPNNVKSIAVVQTPVAGAGGCTDNTSNTIACTIVNEVNEAAQFGTWNFTSGDSGSPIGTHTPGSLVEGTVNLTVATGNPDLCVATSLVEMRQSDSISSILDDLQFSPSATCALQVDVACENLGPDFAAGVFTYRISGNVSTTAGMVDNVVITKLQPAPVEVADGDVDGVNAAGVAWGPFDFTSPVNGGFNTQVKATDPDDNFTEATSAVAACPAVTNSASLSIEKDCIACIVDSGDTLGVLIRAAGKITNTDNDVPILSFDIVETQASTADFTTSHIIASFPTDFTSGSTDFPDPNSNGKLDPGESVFYAFAYTPNDLPGTEDDIAHADDLTAFEDTIDVQSIVAQFDFTVTDPTPVMAQCELCVPGTPGFGLNCAPAAP